VPQSLRSVLRVLVFVGVVLVSVWAASHWEMIEPRALAGWANRHPAAAPAAYLMLRLFGAIALVPGSVMAVGTGIIFGPVLGSIYNLAGSTIGAVAAFLVARFIAADWLVRRFGHSPGLKRLMRAVDTNGWRFVAFVRLVPLFPYNLLNYALGLTRIPLSRYALTSMICMIPGDIAYVYLGYTSGELATDGVTAVRKVLLAVSLLVALTLMPPLIRSYLAPPNSRAESEPRDEPGGQTR
jgi:uncharacterized membrane protein YdjX (TVP38/TMEM64 family)